MSVRKKKQGLKISNRDYVRAVKKADREIELVNKPGWTAKTKIHKSKKTYNRQENKKIEE
jgi:hypothetical protein